MVGQVWNISFRVRHLRVSGTKSCGCIRKISLWNSLREAIVRFRERTSYIGLRNLGRSLGSRSKPPLLAVNFLCRNRKKRNASKLVNNICSWFSFYVTFGEMLSDNQSSIMRDSRVL